MGWPDNPEDYVAIQIGEFARRYGTIYVPWDMWNKLRPASQAFAFYIEAHGRFQIEFDVPIRYLKVIQPACFDRERSQDDVKGANET